MGNSKGKREDFGNIRALPSGRYQARYTGPDRQVHKAPTTFTTKRDARAWLNRMHSDITRDAWVPSDVAAAREAQLFADYSDRWLTHRPLQARTRAHYRSLLDREILPAFGDVAVKHVTPEAVKDWYAATAVDAPTLRSHAYGLLRTILGEAVKDRIIDHNPCHIRGAGNVERAKDVQPATLEELETIVATIPDRYRLLVMLAAWCALRFGELTELRRTDVDLKGGVLSIRRGVVRADGAVIVKGPKTRAGVRKVTIPPHVLPVLREHLLQHAEPGADGLLFPAAQGGHLAPSTLYRVFYKARAAAGRPDLRFHDLRHTGATLAAGAGATLADLMARLGHSTTGAAMRYQHSAQDRDRVIAEALSALDAARRDQAGQA